MKTQTHFLNESSKELIGKKIKRDKTWVIDSENKFSVTCVKTGPLKNSILWHQLGKNKVYCNFFYPQNTEIGEKFYFLWVKKNLKNILIMAYRESEKRIIVIDKIWNNANVIETFKKLIGILNQEGVNNDNQTNSQPFKTNRRN